MGSAGPDAVRAVAAGARPLRADGPGRSLDPRPSACDLADDIRSGRRSALDTLEDTLARIGAQNADLGAFVFLDEPRARRAAERVDRDVRRGRDPGVLAGIPLGVKELQAVGSWPLTYASTAFRDRIADRTATMVDRALRAGAVPVGLTAAPELGRSAFTSSALHGVCRNPWDPTRTPGGSSGGSAAAVASGMVPMATGSDEGGSLRIPAAHCGLVGFKASFGRVPIAPEFTPFAQSSHYGAVTSTVRDTARFLDCVQGPDGMDRTAVPPDEAGYEAAVTRRPRAGLRILWSPDLGFVPCAQQVRQTALAALGRLAASIDAELVDAGQPGAELTIDPEIKTAYRTLSSLDVAALLGRAGRDRRHRFAATVRSYLESADGITVDAIVAAHRCRQRLVEQLGTVLADVDLIATPTVPCTAFDAGGPPPDTIAGRPVDHWTLVGFTLPFNLSGHPAISVPAGLADGLPVGLQLVGRRYADADVLTVAAALERLGP